MLKVSVVDLRKALKKITCLSPQVSGILLEIDLGSVKVYHADGHSTLVDTIEAVSDTAESIIVNAVELDRALAVCQPGQGVEVDLLRIMPDREKKILKIEATKYLKQEGKDRSEHAIEEHQSIPYRCVNESPKDRQLIAEDYEKLWATDSPDIWDKAELISYLKEMICAGGKILTYTTQKKLLFTQSLNYTILQPVQDKGHRYGTVLSIQKAKALTEVLQQMDCTEVNVSNTRAQENSASRLIITAVGGKEGCSCETAAVTTQTIKALEYYSSLEKTETMFMINKTLLQEEISSLLLKRIEQCRGEIIKNNNGKYILKLQDSTVKSGSRDDKSEIYIGDAASGMEGKKFRLNIKSIQSMMSYYTGTSVIFTLIESSEQLNKYIRVEGTDEGSVIMYCTTATE